MLDVSVQLKMLWQEVLSVTARALVLGVHGDWEPLVGVLPLLRLIAVTNPIQLCLLVGRKTPSAMVEVVFTPHQESAFVICTWGTKFVALESNDGGDTGGTGFPDLEP